MIDPRGPRFAAALTTGVLAVVLLTGSAWLLAAQTVVFAIGAFAGLQHSPYGVLFKRFVRPRLAPPSELESSTPPRFAQGVGFTFGLVGTVALALGCRRPLDWSPSALPLRRRSSTRPSASALAARCT